MDGLRRLSRRLSTFGRADAEPTLPSNVIALKALKLRAFCELNSMDLGELTIGQKLHVLEQRRVDGVTRAHVSDTAGRPLGWVTAIGHEGNTFVGDPVKHPEAASGSEPEWIGAIKHCVLFDGKNRAQSVVNFVHQAARPMNVAVGDVIFTQGDAPSMMYLVHSGLYSAQIGTTPTREYGPGDCIGSCELLSHMGCRQSTISVVLPGRLWAIPHHVVDSHLKIPPPITIQGLTDVVRNVPLFGSIANQPQGADRLAQLLRGVRQHTYADGEVLVREGDPARCFFLLQSGEVRSSVANSDFSVTLRPGACFGEAAFLADEAKRVRRATVRAGKAGGATVLTWDVAALETLVGFEFQGQVEKLADARILAKVKVGERELFGELSSDAAAELYRSMHDITFKNKEILAAEGDLDGGIFVVKYGELKAFRTEEMRTKAAPAALDTQDKVSYTQVELVTLRHGDCFGENALIGGVAQPRRRTTITAFGTATVLYCPAASMLVEGSEGAPCEVCGQVTERVLHGTVQLPSAEVSDEVADWSRQLGEYFAASPPVAGALVPAGVDCVIAERLQEDGGRGLGSLGLSHPSKGSQSKGDEKSGRRRGVADESFSSGAPPSPSNDAKRRVKMAGGTRGGTTKDKSHVLSRTATTALFSQVFDKQPGDKPGLVRKATVAIQQAIGRLSAAGSNEDDQVEPSERRKSSAQVAAGLMRQATKALTSAAAPRKSNSKLTSKV